MLNFESDYTNGCHETILKTIIDSNNEILSGYGNDPHTKQAEYKIKKACNSPESEVEFVSGGTQANLLVIASLLQKHEGVISANTGHIAMHENGSVEFTGHKVIEVPQVLGKINLKALKDYLEDFYNSSSEQMVVPGMVYISQPTEYGTLYTISELKTLRQICDKYNMKLFADGARLGYGLSSKEADFTLQDLARLTDVFYIGGTKVGALCGEAIVFKKGIKPQYFTAYKKQHGALLAKTRVVSVQFDALFTDNLYMKISDNAIDMAEKLKDIMRKHNIAFFIDSPTNQQFVILNREKADNLKKTVKYSFWQNYDKDNIVARFATSWATTDSELENLDKALSKAGY